MKIPAIRKTYQGEVVLNLPELEIAEGSTLAVFGQNGSGKSTFAKILAGIETADGEKRPGRSNGSEILPGRSVGYMSQQTLAFCLSVKNNLMQNADPHRSRSENEARAEELMKKIGLEAEAGKNAQKLSGGQRQRMGLARILMRPYDILILDEPTSSLDKKAEPLAEELIRSYRKETGGILILITHSPEQAKRLADTFLYLEDGKIKSSEVQNKDPGEPGSDPW